MLKILMERGCPGRVQVEADLATDGYCCGPLRAFVGAGFTELRTASRADDGATSRRMFWWEPVRSAETELAGDFGELLATKVPTRTAVTRIGDPCFRKGGTVAARELTSDAGLVWVNARFHDAMAWVTKADAIEVSTKCPGNRAVCYVRDGIVRGVVMPLRP